MKIGDLYRKICAIKQERNQQKSEMIDLGKMPFITGKRSFVEAKRDEIWIDADIAWQAGWPHPPNKSTDPDQDIESLLKWTREIITLESAVQKATPQGPDAVTQVFTNIIVAPQTPHPSEHHDEILQALLELKALDVHSRRSTTEIARRAIGPNAEPALLKESVSELRRRGLIETKRGRKGGAWLTSSGRVKAEIIAGS